MRPFLRHAPAVLGVLLLIGAVYVVQREYRHLKLDDITAALHAIPTRARWHAAGFALLAYGVLTFYDRLGTLYAGQKVSYPRVAFASFCAYALAHNLGFAAVSGAAVRYRLYAHWGLSPMQIGKVIGFCSLTFGLGGMVLGGAILIGEPAAVPFFGGRVPDAALYATGGAMVAVVIGYVTLARAVGKIRLFGQMVELPGVRMAILQVLLATVDVAVTAAIFYALLPAAPGLSFLRLLAVYLASYSAGLLASLPGGIGVFDGAMLLGLSPYLEAPQIVGAILIFRLYYYVIPLFLAGAMFAGNEVVLRSRDMLRPASRRGALPAVGRWSEPDFAVAAATGAVALCGAMLLSLGALAIRPDFSWLDRDIAVVATEAGEFVPSLLGAALLVLAIGLAHRVTLAWGATVLMLLAGAAFTAARGDGPWVPGGLILATFVIAPYRRAFYRHARLLAGPLELSAAVPLLGLVVCVLTLAAFEKHVRGTLPGSWWQIVLSPKVPNSLRASVALSVLVGAIAIWRLIRPGRVAWTAWGPEARLRFAALGGDPPVRADGMVWGETERAAIPFRRGGRVLLGLGDPAGAGSDRVSAIWRLRDLAEQEGLHLAIHGTGPSLLQVYADVGLAAFPLGADGLPLSEGEAPASGAARHYLVCRPDGDLSLLLPLLAEMPGRRLEPTA